MATYPSAEKRHRQNIKRRDRNRHARATVRTAIKSAIETAKSGDKEAAELKAKKASSLLDKAVVHGLLHKNTVRRTISRMYRQINSDQSAQ